VLYKKLVTCGTETGEREAEWRHREKSTYSGPKPEFRVSRCPSERIVVKRKKKKKMVDLEWQEKGQEEEDEAHSAKKKKSPQH